MIKKNRTPSLRKAKIASTGHPLGKRATQAQQGGIDATANLYRVE